MIAVRCPFCQVGLKVDEAKLPHDITFFPCPKCKRQIPASILSAKKQPVDAEPETSLIHPLRTGIGCLTVLPDENTQEQVFSLQEGELLIGRKSDTSHAFIAISTSDRSMSREHARIEVKKDAKGGYKHYLSDNNSKNRTLYNCNYLGDGEIVVLKDNDEIILGRTVLRFNE